MHLRQYMLPALAYPTYHIYCHSNETSRVYALIFIV